MEYEVRISTAEYPRKATQYAVWVVPVTAEAGSFRGGICVHPLTEYKAQADLTVAAYRALLSDPNGAAAVTTAIEEMP